MASPKTTKGRKESVYTGNVFKSGKNTQLHEIRVKGTFEKKFEQANKTGHVAPQIGVGKTDWTRQQNIVYQNKRPVNNQRRMWEGAAKNFNPSSIKKTKDNAGYHSSLVNGVSTFLKVKSHENFIGALKKEGAYKRNQAVPKGYDYTPHMSAIHKHVQATGNVTEGIRKGSLETKFKGNPATIKKYYYKWEKENRKNNK